MGFSWSGVLFFFFLVVCYRGGGGVGLRDHALGRHALEQLELLEQLRRLVDLEQQRPPVARRAVAARACAAGEELVDCGAVDTSVKLLRLASEAKPGSHSYALNFVHGHEMRHAYADALAARGAACFDMYIDNDFCCPWGPRRLFSARGTRR